MKKTKLIHLLAYLNPDEFKSLLQFAKSPYHNSNKQVTALLESLHPYHPAFDYPKLTKGFIFKKMQKKQKPYDDGRMNVIMSQSVKLFNQFLAFEQLKKDEFKLNKYRINAYREKHMDDEFKKATQKQEKALETWRKDEKYHLEKLLLNRKIFYHPTTPRHQPGMPSLQKSMEALDMFFVWEKLKLSAIVLNRGRILNEIIHIALLQDATQKFSDFIENSNELKIFKKIIHAQITDDDKVLATLTNAFINIAEELPDKVKYEVLVYVNNLVSQKIRQGKIKFYKNAFELNKFRIKNIFDKYENSLTDVAFTNIVSIGCMIQEFDWTENFIDKYKRRLSSDNKEDAIGLAMAYLHYFKTIASKDENRFSKTIDYLNGIDTKIPFYYYRLKLLILRIYYEYYLQNNDYYFFVLDFCNAFEQQLKRDKMMGYDKKNTFVNFVKISKKMLLMSMEVELKIKEKERLLLFVNDKRNVFAKEWLLEKIRELKAVP